MKSGLAYLRSQYNIGAPATFCSVSVQFPAPASCGKAGISGFWRPYRRTSDQLSGVQRPFYRESSDRLSGVQRPEDPSKPVPQRFSRLRNLLKLIYKLLNAAGGQRALEMGSPAGRLNSSTGIDIGRHIIVFFGFNLRRRAF